MLLILIVCLLVLGYTHYDTIIVPWLSRFMLMLQGSVLYKRGWLIILSNFAKKGLTLKLRKLIIDVLFFFLIKAHAPFRDEVEGRVEELKEFFNKAKNGWEQLSTFKKVSLCVVVACVSTSFSAALLVFFVIPDALVRAVKKYGFEFAERFGLTGVDIAAKKCVPSPLRCRWKRFKKWRLGRLMLRIRKRGFSWMIPYNQKLVAFLEKH